MDDLWSFVTSPEAVIVYIVVGLSCILCLIIYLVERYNVKAKRRHNTRELNKLVEQVRDEFEEKETVSYDQPVLEVIHEDQQARSVTEMLERTVSLYEKPQDDEIEEEKEPEIIETEPLVIENVDIEKEVQETETFEEIEEMEEETQEELEYTTIEPNPMEAREELNKLTEEIQQTEEIDEVQNEALTSFEEQQEETAIISLEELIQKGKIMYETNELTQYEDEGNVPISLGELEQRIGKEATPCLEPFILENVVDEEEAEMENSQEVVNPVVEVTTLEQEETVKRWKSSPIISPVFGIEKENDLSLENTANYEKFDAAKTNEFLMTLKDLQENIE